VSLEQIWAPWRLAYVKQSPSDGPKSRPAIECLPGGDPTCFLCQAAVDDANPDRHVVCQTEHTLTVLNRFPYNNGHLLVAPRRHCSRLDQLTVEEHGEIMQAVSQMVTLLEKVLEPHGFNIGLNLGSASGAGLPGHLHWHVVPRWNGDTNFMLALAAVKVIPQSLDELYAALTTTLHQGGSA